MSVPTRGRDVGRVLAREELGEGGVDDGAESGRARDEDVEEVCADERVLGDGDARTRGTVCRKARAQRACGSIDACRPAAQRDTREPECSGSLCTRGSRSRHARRDGRGCGHGVRGRVGRIDVERDGRLVCAVVCDTHALDPAARRERERPEVALPARLAVANKKRLPSSSCCSSCCRTWCCWRRKQWRRRGRERCW